MKTWDKGSEGARTGRVGTRRTKIRMLAWTQESAQPLLVFLAER